MRVEPGWRRARRAGPLAGVSLQDLLDRASPHRGATQILGRSVDGFTAGFPTRTVLDLREAMVAVAMNGEPLPARHGFPARIVVPGLYGYVSATKWLSEIRLANDDAKGYWISRGWTKNGPMKIQCRIDVPRAASTAPLGPQLIAGVAWAPPTGLSGVEVWVDGQPWRPAYLAAEINRNSWRQWQIEWTPAPGFHVIVARAIDGNGQVQTSKKVASFPNGASGHHAIQVRVPEAD